MMSKLWALCRRCFTNETISYLFFGVLTTVVNYIVFWLALRLMGENNALWANVIAFVAAIIFAYVTNKLFVFDSKSWAWSVLCREIPTFIGGRLFSFGLEELGLWLCVDVLAVGEYALFGINGVLIAKAVLNIVVIVVNYILSKFLIFRKKNRD